MIWDRLGLSALLLCAAINAMAQEAEVVEEQPAAVETELEQAIEPITESVFALKLRVYALSDELKQLRLSRLSILFIPSLRREYGDAIVSRLEFLYNERELELQEKIRQAIREHETAKSMEPKPVGEEFFAAEEPGANARKLEFSKAKIERIVAHRRGLLGAAFTVRGLAREIKGELGGELLSYAKRLESDCEQEGDILQSEMQTAIELKKKL